MSFHVHDLDLRLLRVFESIVRNNGFAGAQAELNIAASTLSNHLAALEDRVGSSLCSRGRSGFKLTAQGIALFAATEELFGAISEFEKQSSSLKETVADILRCGVLDSVLTDENYRLHDAIYKYLGSGKHLRIALSEENPQTLQEKLLSDQLDVGVGSFPYKTTGLDFKPIYEEKHSLYCARRHPLFACADDDISRSDLLRFQVAGRTYWRDSDQRKLGLNADSAKASHIEAQLTLILSGAYIGLLPDHTASSWIAKGELRPLLIDQMSYSCKFEIATKSRKSLPDHVVLFISAIESVYDNSKPLPK